ncbi:hypothetical protein N8878_01035 [Psychromonas sp.]|nr:hypothetical protein [Psychromonas sp.]
MFKKVNLIALPAILLLTACSSSNPTQETVVGQIPSWILNPQVEDGIAVSECVLWSGNMSIDRQHAISNARTALAQRIESRVSALDKSYRDKVEVTSGAESGSTFSSVSKQITEQTLVGTTALKTDIVKIAKKDNLCVLVAIGQQSTKKVFDELIKAADRPMNSSQKNELYQQFKSQQTEKMDQELENLESK